MRRAFEHPLAPALGCALVCLAYLIVQPATADMAAHSYRAWLFEHQGLTVWNAQWYGGHHVLGYSLLFAPFAMLRQNTLKHGNYSKRVRRYVRRVSRVGENLAWMRGCDPSDIVAMWARSSGHRRVMLSRSFRRVGVAQRSRSNACFVTADFGTAR